MSPLKKIIPASSAFVFAALALVSALLFAAAFGETELHRRAVSPDSIRSQYDVGQYRAFVKRSGAVLNARDRFGRTPLHRSVTDGHFTQWGALLTAGADPNIPANDGTYPIHHVADENYRHYYNYDRDMTALLEAGARPEHDPRPDRVHMYDFHRTTDAHRRMMMRNGLMDLEWELRDGETGNRLHFELARNNHAGILRLINFGPELGVDANARDSRGRTAPHFAAKLRDQWILLSMRALGADLAAADNDGMLAVHHAAAGWFRIFNILASRVARGPDPFTLDNQGRSAVHHAAGSDNPDWRFIMDDLARRASAMGRDLGDFEMNRPDNNGVTPADIARQAGKTDLAERLEENANPDRLDENGLPRLHRAVSDGDLERVAILLENGASVELAVGESQTRPLHRAAEHARVAPEIAKALLDAGADINAQDATGRVPLHYAAVAGNIPVANLLLENGAAPDIRDDAGDKPLDAARAADNAEFAAVLESATFNPDEMIDGKPRLHHAVLAGDIDEVARLLDLGADIEARDEAGDYTALFLTSPYTNRTHDTEYPDIAHLLLERGAEPNPISGHWRKNTPLLRAAGLGHVEVVRVLLDGGANPAMENSDGHNAHQVASFQSYVADARFNERRRRVAEIILPHMDEAVIALAEERRAAAEAAAEAERIRREEAAETERIRQSEAAEAERERLAKRSPVEKLLDAIRSRDTNEVRRLLNDENANPAGEHNGETPMRAAQSQNDTETALLLADAIAAAGNENGAHLNAQNEKGRAAVLHVAASRGMTDRVKSYLAAGADPNLRDKYGRTPLMRAVWGGQSSPIIPLLEAGADPTVPNNDGQTPLQYAESNGRQDLAAALREATGN